MPSICVSNRTGNGYCTEQRITSKGQVQYLISLGCTEDYRYIVRQVDDGELEIYQREGKGYLLLAVASADSWIAALQFCVDCDEGWLDEDDYSEIELLRK